MKVLIYSNCHMADCDIPLIHALQDKGIDVYYLLEMRADGAKGTIIDVPVGKRSNDIIPATEYKELEIFSEYLDLTKVFIRNSYRKHKLTLIDELSLSLKTFMFLLHHKFNVIQRTQVFFRTDVILYHFRKSLIKMVHDPFPHSGNTMKGQTLFFYKLGLKIFKHFVILNKNQYQAFCDVYKKNPENVLLTQLGVYDCYNIYNTSSTIKPNNILFFGRISKYKGVEYLCQAMNIVLKHIPNATLTIAGGGDLYFDTADYINNPNIEFRNHFISVNELSDLISSCTVVACPYTDATQSGVVMTAYSKNKPVVATSVGGLTEQIVDGKTGLLVSPCNPNELADALIKILTNKTLQKEMVDNIKTMKSEGEISWSSIADRYISFYHKI